MKKLFALLIISIFLFSVNSFGQNIKDQIPDPKTKLESMTTKTGNIIVKGFEEIGTAYGKYNTSATVESKEFTTVADGEKRYGITIEVKKDDKYEKKSTSYIDYDEIDSLIKGIEYISKVDKNATKLSSFQADYSTKGNFKISTFSTNSGKIMAAVSSGSYGGVAAYYELSDLQKIKKLISDAKLKIDSIK